MAKIKISGAKPSHPPAPPESCNASRNRVLIQSRRPCRTNEASASAHFQFYRRSSLLITPGNQAGDLQLRTRTGDAELWFRLRPDFRKKTSPSPKFNRMTYPPHSVKIEA